MENCSRPSSRSVVKGFTLIELTVAAVVLAFILGSAAYIANSIGKVNKTTDQIRAERQLKDQLASGIDCETTFSSQGIDRKTLTPKCDYTSDSNAVPNSDTLTIKRCVKDPITRKCDHSKIENLGSDKGADGNIRVAGTALRVYCSKAESGLVIKVVETADTKLPNQIKNGEMLFGGTYLPLCSVEYTPLSQENSSQIVTDASDSQDARCGIIEGKFICTGALNGSLLQPTVDGLTNATRVYLARSLACAEINTKLHCWGANTSGQLGLGDNSSRSQPTVVKDGGTEIANIRAFDTTGINSCVVLSTGQVRCWGNNSNGQSGVFLRRGVLGDGSNVDSANQPKTVIKTDGTPLTDVSQISVSTSDVCAISQGKLYCWGHNEWGAHGTGDRVASNKAKLSTLFPSNVSAVAVASSRAYVVHNGSLWRTIGNNSPNPPTKELMTLNGAPSTGVTQLVPGRNGDVCALVGGKVYCDPYYNRGGAGGLTGPGTDLLLRYTDAGVALEGVDRLLRPGDTSGGYNGYYGFALARGQFYALNISHNSVAWYLSLGPELFSRLAF